MNAGLRASLGQKALGREDLKQSLPYGSLFKEIALCVLDRKIF